MFYNYCASASLLIDSTRVYLSDLEEEYYVQIDHKRLDEEKKNRFNNKTCEYIKIFRNLFSHV